MNAFNLQDTIALLARTPATLNALLRDLPATWTMRNEGENTWSPFDIVGHFIHGEHADWVPRAKMILQFGENRTFVPFDRWAQERQSQGKSLDQRLDEFAGLRSENLVELRALNLQKEDDLTHLHQISRVMAHQYREAVGPWSKYLGVMRCAGHSD
jgi:hypothetical protein